MSTAARPVLAKISGDQAPQLELSIVMPCLNEAETLATCIQKAQAALREHGIAGEVVIADNGSTDGSQQIAASLGARVVPVERKGYGSALQGGIQAALGTYVLMGDADDSYDFSHLDRFLEKLRAGADLVMGNRFLGGINPGAMPTLHRYLGNPVLTALGRLFFRSPVGDFHCGLRAFRKDAFERMQLRSPGMEFASEMVVRATLLNMNVTEVPTTLSKDGRSRPPHLRTWRDGWRHLRFLLLYSPRYLFFVPGTTLLILGGLTFLALLFGPIRVGRVTFDVHTMLYGAFAMMVGFQAVVFATFAKVLGVTQGLLPPNATLDRMFKWFTLEIGVLVGSALTLVGIAILAAAVLIWQRLGFGPLTGPVTPVEMTRIVVPGLVCATLGIEIVFSSFFLSILGYVKKG